MIKEHEEFMEQVSESGVPLWMLQYYGEPKPLNNDNNQKTREDLGHDHASNPDL